MKYEDLHNKKDEINVGSDVWLARNVRILNGVNISNGVVVAESSFVNRDCVHLTVFMLDYLQNLNHLGLMKTK